MRRASSSPQLARDIRDRITRQQHPWRYTIEDLQVYELHEDDKDTGVRDSVCRKSAA